MFKTVKDVIWKEDAEEKEKDYQKKLTEINSKTKTID
jgi:hypothetical protein